MSAATESVVHVALIGAGSFGRAIADMLARLDLPPETISGVGDVFRMRLYDPVLDREIRHAYHVDVLGDDLADRRPTAHALLLRDKGATS